MSWNAKSLPLWQEIIYHASHNHIHECVDPERGDKDQDEPDSVPHFLCLVIDRHDAKDKCSGLPETAHGNNNSVPFLVYDTLRYMCSCCEAEEDDEKVGGCDGGTEVAPLVLGVICSETRHLEEQSGSMKV